MNKSNDDDDDDHLQWTIVKQEILDSLGNKEKNEVSQQL